MAPGTDAAPSVPITLLTGFLGSGKTTLCNRLVHRPEMREALVLVNEAGEVSVDHHLVEEIEERVVVLPSGCVCCALRDDLVGVLGNEQLTRSRSRVLIETSGLADPTPLVATVMKHPSLRERFHVDAVVVALDATRGSDLIERFPEAAKQLALADRVIVTKCDLATVAQVEAAEALAAALCPEALVSRGLPDGVLGAGSRRGGELEESHSHTHGIRTFVVESEKPARYRSFAAWLSMMSQLNGDRLLRLKGLLHVDDHPDPVVVQTVQHVVYPTYTLPAWPDARPRTRLVGITQDMSETMFDDVVKSLRGVVGG